MGRDSFREGYLGAARQSALGETFYRLMKFTRCPFVRSLSKHGDSLGRRVHSVRYHGSRRDRDGVL